MWSFRAIWGFWRCETYLVPLTDTFLATFLEEALVVRDAVLAVDEAVRENWLAIALISARMFPLFTVVLVECVLTRSG